MVDSGWLKILKIDGITAALLFAACLTYLLIGDYFSPELGEYKFLVNAITLAAAILTGPVALAGAINKIIEYRSHTSYQRQKERRIIDLPQEAKNLLRSILSNHEKEITIYANYPDRGLWFKSMEADRIIWAHREGGQGPERTKIIVDEDYWEILRDKGWKLLYRGKHKPSEPRP